MFCKYKDALGKPNEEFHKDRLFGFAQNDLLGTVLLAYIISKQSYIKITFIKAFILCMIFAIVIHELFCVKTKLNMMLFNN